MMATMMALVMRPNHDGNFDHCNGAASKSLMGQGTRGGAKASCIKIGQ
jgi:hypothetical protein